MSRAEAQGGRRQRWGWRLLWLWALVSTGCTARAVTPPALSGSEDPGAMYAALRQHEERIRTLRARFAARVVRTAEVRSADGVLLVKKPDSFRLRLFSPFGLTVLDYTSVAGDVRVHLPLAGRQLNGPAAAAADTPLPSGQLQQAFLRADAAFPGECLPARNGDAVVITCRSPDGGGRLRQVRLSGATGLPSEEISYTDGDRPALITRFDDYRVVDGVALPFSVVIVQPDHDLTLTINVRSYEVNPSLPDELFAGDF